MKYRVIYERHCNTSGRATVAVECTPNAHEELAGKRWEIKIAFGMEPTHRNDKITWKWIIDYGTHLQEELIHPTDAEKITRSWFDDENGRWSQFPIDTYLVGKWPE